MVLRSRAVVVPATSGLEALQPEIPSKSYPHPPPDNPIRLDNTLQKPDLPFTPHILRLAKPGKMANMGRRWIPPDNQEKDLQSSHSSQSNAARRRAWGPAVRRALAAAAALLALTSTAGCMVEAMYAVPVALDTAGSAIAHALPLNEKKYIVHSTRVPPGEPTLAAAPEPAPNPALTDAGNATQYPPQPYSPAQIAAPTPAAASPMPVLIDSALARRTRT
jgi:hypothetical protein